MIDWYIMDMDKKLVVPQNLLKDNSIVVLTKLVDAT